MYIGQVEGPKEVPPDKEVPFQSSILIAGFAQDTFIILSLP